MPTKPYEIAAASITTDSSASLSDLFCNLTLCFSSSRSSHHATLISADERTEVSRAHGMDSLSAVSLPAPKGGLRLSQSTAGLEVTNQRQGELLKQPVQSLLTSPPWPQQHLNQHIQQAT
ncbi:uncharacterized protein ACIB01_000308 isoform 1-T1 [Guaruba guarouba]